MKVKSWNITVIDNPNITTALESDEFYTTDTEAFLIFNLLDEDFHPTSATITLHNRTDGSVVNEDVPVVSGVIEYEMRHEVIKHAGVWRAQVVYKQDKDGVPEKYTSKVVSFGVSGHLLRAKEPPLFLIENWNNFILSAESLIEGWKQNEALRAAAERKRDAAEDSRVSEENKRVSAESDRESAEGKRASTFTYNENSRKAEFESNEAVRQSNETDRQDNELVRQSQEESREAAESQRVAAEQQRVTADAEREAKLTAKADKTYVDAELEKKANRKQEEWITPTLVNGWTDYADAPFQFRKDEFGRVHFRGRLSTTNVTDGFFCELPEGYRPVNDAYINWGQDPYISVLKNGNCQNYFTDWSSMEGFSYSTT